jgi:hypothetical protein
MSCQNIRRRLRKEQEWKSKHARKAGRPVPKVERVGRSRWHGRN